MSEVPTIATEPPERRRAADRARRLDALAIALLLALAVLQVLSVAEPPSGPPEAVLTFAPFPPRILAALGGLMAAAVLVLLAVARARRAAWARPATVASLVVLIGLLLLDGERRAGDVRVSVPLACLALLLVILQRRGHPGAAVTSRAFVLAAATALTFAAGLFLQRIYS
jgi:peptidoglycan/LPS O-acetylase OafA/YrhL